MKTAKELSSKMGMDIMNIWKNDIKNIKPENKLINIWIWSDLWEEIKSNKEEIANTISIEDAREVLKIYKNKMDVINTESTRIEEEYKKIIQRKKWSRKKKKSIRIWI